MRVAIYYILSFLNFLVSFIGFIGFKFTIIIIGAGMALFMERYFGKFGFTIGWIIGLFIIGVLFTLLQRLPSYLDKLDSYTKTFREYPYTEKYGIDYPEPKPEAFGISPKEFQEYNTRFQFEYSQIIFTYGIVISVLIYLIQTKTKGATAILIAGSTGIIAIIFNYLFDYWNKKISMKHPHYKKITRFQESLDIYHKIRSENSRI